MVFSMDLNKACKHSPLERNPEKKIVETFIGVWLTDQHSGFSLGLEGDAVKRFSLHTENVNHSIKLDFSTWRQIITHELSMYEAIIAGKVSIDGDHWEVIQFFDHCQSIILDGYL